MNSEILNLKNAYGLLNQLYHCLEDAGRHNDANIINDIQSRIQKMLNSKGVTNQQMIIFANENFGITCLGDEE